jgi:acyl-CoA reductase-like NAD-dependent aldehyde dehydrogenase
MTSETRPVDPVVTLFSDGVLSDSACDSTVAVTNPSNGRQLFSLPAGSVEDVDRAVSSSRRALDEGRWRDLAPSLKKKSLHRFAELIAAEAAALDALDAEEMGKPVSLELGNAKAASELIHFAAETIDKITGEVYASDGHSFVAQRRVPRGVVAAIVPWNFPSYSAAIKLGPALAAGNCVVLKPSELSSRSAVLLAQLALNSGIPPGVLNVVPGLGGVVGRALGLHHDVDMVSFTGSTDVGKMILQYAGQSNMKKVLTECGGKSPHIVFNDGVDIESTADWIARSCLVNQGQLCTLGSRLLVQRSVESRMLEHIVRGFAAITMGDASDSRTTFGPLASAGQCERVANYVAIGHAEGARLVMGGRRVHQESGSCFFEPTVFADVKPEARIAQEEIFGPVLSVTAFEDEAEAIRIANGTIYGLSAYVWTADLSRAMRMMKGIRSAVRINGALPKGRGAGHAASNEPFGQSGLGSEGGVSGVESYMHRQLVWINYA